MRRLVYIAVFILWPMLALASHAEREMPELKNGDLIFQTQKTEQTLGVMAATNSLLTHVGIVHMRDGKAEVLDSAGKVGYSPLEQWVARGQNERFAIYRHKKLSPEKAEQLFAEAEQYMGAPYDAAFVFDNAALYCSELPYLLFQKISKPIGSVQTLEDLHVEEPHTQELIASRWQQHPYCQVPGETLATCYPKMLKQKLVTPGSLARDKHMQQIYSNY